MKLLLALRWPAAYFCVLAAASLALAQQGDRDGHNMVDPPADLEIPPAPIVPPGEAIDTFEVAEGFELQLVASEPLVHDPVCMAWDGDGRLWVCEMRGYMPDVDGKGEGIVFLERFNASGFAGLLPDIDFNGENIPNGNIVILDDTDGDGVMDTRTEFLGGIVLPRAIAFTNGGILYADQEKLYFVRIAPDGTPGGRSVVDRNYSQGGNVEHKPNGLLYGLDNWYYNAKSASRYQSRRGRWLEQTTEHRGQWGITQDDQGRLLTNDNSNFIHGELLPPSATLRNPNFDFGNRPIYRTGRAVYPIRVTPGVNRGYQPGTVSHETWKLIAVTGASGPVIYRGDQYPDEFYNNVFIPEPCGNLLKRVVLTEVDGRVNATHAYDDREFIASTDERNRFVNTYNGPDGCLYVVDMYRGIIQHKTYVTSYLRRQIESRGLDQHIGRGRIYRVVFTGNDIPDERPAMSEQSSIELVAHLTRRNAWWRETAQRLLVERRDPNAAPALRQLAGDLGQPQGQIHALWALHGMGMLDIATLEAASHTADNGVRVQVVRLAEHFATFDEGKDAPRALAILERYNTEPSWQTDMQLALSAGILAGLDTQGGYDVLLSVLERRGDDGLFRRAVVSGLRGKEAVMLSRVTEAGGGPIVNELTAALVKSIETGDLSIGSLIELIDSDMFDDDPAQRLALLGTLGEKTVQMRRDDVALMLVDRMAAPDAPEDQTLAILQGIQRALPPNHNPIELDGEPELFQRWREDPPVALAEFMPLLEDHAVFTFEKTIVSDELAEFIAYGREKFNSVCSECHGFNGEGAENRAPPLAGSEWVHGNGRMLASLVLNGVQGPISVAGTVYTDSPGSGEVQVESEMVGFKTNDSVSDRDLAAILTYARTSWGNAAPPIAEDVIARVRTETADRGGSFTAAQLKLITPDEGEVLAEAPELPKRGIDTPGWLDRPMLGMVVMLAGVTLIMLVLLVPTYLLNRGSGDAPAVVPHG